MVIFHDPRCIEYSAPGHPERPQRIARTVPLLKARHRDWNWHWPADAQMEALGRAHSSEHIASVKTAFHEFDADTPAYPHIYDYALRSAGAAIGAAHAGLRGDAAISLMRPPGHHATRTRAMGFCYFSNIALAALDVLQNGAERVGIWDFDAHHGNGTEEIVANNPRIAFASIHQSPGYPGTGLRSFDNVNNFPLPPYTRRTEYVEVAQRALETILDFKPDLILVSAGFDGFRNDPITQMTLESEDFATFGTWLRQTTIPVSAILEGGYSEELPELIDAFLSAWESLPLIPSSETPRSPSPNG